ncbi:MAG: alpha/beta hydrolase [Candidatus Thiodiazotropha sp.]
MFNWLRWIFLFAPCLCVSGCALLEVQQEAEAVYSSTVLVGWVSAEKDWVGPIVVAAYTAEADNFKPVHCARLHEIGGFELIVPNGRYQLVAFGDANRNLRLDAGEPVGAYLGVHPVLADGSGVVAQLDMEIKRSDMPPPVALGTSFSDCGIQPDHSTQAGAIADLDDPLFSREYGNKAYWKPMEFFRQVGGNIYFLEPYDPAKIPILFVHGAAGSPQDWRYFFEHMDRSRYQPWIFYYPSGAGIDSMAHLLSWKLFTLRLKYRFDKLYIAAHSMGGLVVRSFLIDHNKSAPNVKLFVSLATPWGGEPAAELGVKYSPGVIPSWIDMQPQGEYMQSLFARKLSSDIDYYLLFGFKGGSSLVRPNNDGTVTLASALRSAAQAEAKQVYGFDEDHVSILSSAQVLKQFEAILDSAEGERKSANPLEPGYVRVTSVYPEGEQSPLGNEVLWLRPRDRRGEAIFLPLLRDTARREVGPIPPGEYDAILVAQSFAAVPGSATIRIKSGESADLRFELKPQGVLWGYIGAGSGDAELPAGSYVPPAESIEIQSIGLRGEGITRELLPAQAAEGDADERFLARKDFISEAQFFFFDLPAGDYRLTVSAKGYRPYSGRYTVVPGHPGQWRPVVLQPEP